MKATDGGQRLFDFQRPELYEHIDVKIRSRIIGFRLLPQIPDHSACFIPCHSNSSTASATFSTLSLAVLKLYQPTRMSLIRKLLVQSFFLASTDSIRSTSGGIRKERETTRFLGLRRKVDLRGRGRSIRFAAYRREGE